MFAVLWLPLLVWLVSGDYCRGTASIDQVALFTEPACDLGTSFVPPLSKAVAYEPVRLSNLSFCCKTNYTSLLALGTDVWLRDLETRWAFENTADQILMTDCAALYPFHSCEPCLEAYRTWLCSWMFPMKCLGASENVLRLCDSLCLEVQRKCPSSFRFICPLDEGTSDNGDGKYSPWIGNTPLLFGNGGCNPAHYNLGPGSPFGDNEKSGAELLVLGIAWFLVVAIV